MSSRTHGLSTSQWTRRKSKTTTTSSKSRWVRVVDLSFIDLEKVQKKLNEGLYRTREQFKYDIIKIFDNARTYNQEDTIYYKYANQLQGHVKHMLDRLKEGSLLPPDAIPAFVDNGIKRRSVGGGTQEQDDDEGSSKKLLAP